jgi:AmmeMemoRadiSam system protein B/AmmeMemoRadiSam system protein A
MRARAINYLLIFAIMIFYSNCHSQNNPTESPCIDREPYAAGKFYSNNPEELRSDLKKLFEKAVPKKTENVLAIIAPHAGYIFSGEVAASAYNQIDRNKKYEHIFMIASSHVKYMDGASVYYRGNYKTPLGTVKVDRELAKKLVDENSVFRFDQEADAYEHSLEVQLPFLQYLLGNNLNIVPIIIGGQSPKVSEEIAAILKPYLNGKNLFVISSDFSHYPRYQDAITADIATANAIISNDSRELIKAINANTDKNYPNLVTSLCGWTSVVMLLSMTEKNPDIQITPVQYMNSGDTPYGDKNRVVGYYALAVSTISSSASQTGQFELSDEDKVVLLRLARNTVDSYVRSGRIPAVDEATLSENVKTPCGAFVTLHKDGKLRGCIGRFSPDEPLYKVVQQMSVSSSTQDSRFPAVSPDELNDIEIEISVLTPLKKISSIDEIELGKHGIYIKQGYSSGTFLPQVATETGWSKEEFLGHCSRDKAGLGWDGWKTAELFTYEALIFSEKEYGSKTDK